jgi:hypothetical protein
MIWLTNCISKLFEEDKISCQNGQMDKSDKIYAVNP